MTKQLVILGTHGIPAKHGGFETCAEKLAIYLTTQGWQVTVFCSGHTNGINTWHGVTCHTIKTSHLSGWRKYLTPLLYDWHAIWASRHRDAIFLTMGYNTALFNIVLWFYKRRQIFNMDGMEWQRSKYQRAHEKIWLKLNEYAALRIADTCIADHPVIANYLVKRYAHVPITTIAYGADTIDPTQSDPAILNNYGLSAFAYGLIIARPEPENQILEIVQAWQASGVIQPLVILGRYDANNVYHRQVQQTAADANVLFIGAIYGTPIVTALRIYAAVYLHGHTVGGTNPSLVEAMAAGCLIVAHDNPFNRGVAADAAWYFSDQKILANHIQAVFQNPQGHILRTKAREHHANHYQWLPILQQYEQLLDGLVQTRV